MREPDFSSILSHFGITPVEDGVSPFGDGLINDTYLVKTPAGESDYILQRVNHEIFRDIEGLHHNIALVTSHIRKKLQQQGVKDIDRKCLKYIPEIETGKLYYFDGKYYWRVSEYIPDTESRLSITAENARLAGKAFGEFEAILADLNGYLIEPIPDFHNLEFRNRQFEEAISLNRAGRVGEVMKEIEILRDKLDEYTEAERLYKAGKIDKRICHCDPKLSNILFNTDGSIACVIDLDTVMPSFITSDFGDFLRSAANSTDENDPEMDNISFRKEIYEAFKEGYLEITSDILTEDEKKLLPQAMGRFAYMQAMRFLTDYLNGDSYYKITCPEHNLIRARNQLRLLFEVEKALNL